MSPFGGHHRRRSSGGVVGNSERSGELSTTPPLKLNVRSGFMVGKERFLPGMIGARDVMGTGSIDLLAVGDFGFTGQRNLDAQGNAPLGLMDYNARMYDPLLARFIQPDIIIQALGVRKME